MTKKFKIVYDLDGYVSACIVEANSKYNAKQNFYLKYPRATVIKIEPVGDEYDREA